MVLYFGNLKLGLLKCLIPKIFFLQYVKHIIQLLSDKNIQLSILKEIVVAKRITHSVHFAYASIMKEN